MDGRTQWIFSKGGTVDYHSTAIDPLRFRQPAPLTQILHAPDSSSRAKESSDGGS